MKIEEKHIVRGAIAVCIFLWGIVSAGFAVFVDDYLETRDMAHTVHFYVIELQYDAGDIGPPVPPTEEVRNAGSSQ